MQDFIQLCDSIENAIVKLMSRNDCPLGLTECSTWLTYDALESNWPALEIWIPPRVGFARFSSERFVC